MSEVLNIEKIGQIRGNVISEISKLRSKDEISNLRIKYLGRKGIVSKLLRSIHEIPIDQRKIFGQKLNILKEELELLFEEKSNEGFNEFDQFNKEKSLQDISLPGRKGIIGNLHPTSKVVREICKAFTPMGFQIVEGPEIELDKYNFEL